MEPANPAPKKSSRKKIVVEAHIVMLLLLLAHRWIRAVHRLNRSRSVRRDAVIMLGARGDRACDKGDCERRGVGVLLNGGATAHGYEREQSNGFHVIPRVPVMSRERHHASCHGSLTSAGSQK